MKIDEITKEIVEEIYYTYGSGTGVLFGIPSNQRNTVETIIQIAIEGYREKHPGFEQIVWHLDEILRGSQIELNVASIKGILRQESKNLF